MSALIVIFKFIHILAFVQPLKKSMNSSPNIDIVKLGCLLKDGIVMWRILFVPSKVAFADFFGKSML